MLITNYVPLTAAVQEVYRLLPKDQVDYNEIYEWAYNAYEALMVRQSYEDKMYLVDVTNHTAELPKGLVFIEQMFYKDTTEDSDETTNVPIYTGDMAVTEITTTDWEFLLADNSQIWQPLRLSPSIWSNTFVCSNSPTIGAVSEHTYTVTKDRCIITSFESGQICIGGLAYPTKNGELLIPDHRDVREAIKYNVLMTYFLVRDILQTQGASNLEVKYRRYWEIYAAKCRGTLMLMGIDQLENFRTQMQRIGQHNETYNNAFSNLSTQENINLNG